MHASPQLRKMTLCALVIGGLLGLAWAGRSTAARTIVPAAQIKFGTMLPTGGFGGAVEEVSPPGRVVYVREPLSAKALAVRAKLSQPLAMPFPHETPLEDVLRYIQNSTEGPDMKGGIPIYLDPAGLTEAEKTPSSPIIINLEGVPIAKSLSLLLKQLDLAYVVDEDGILIITSAGSADLPGDPTKLVLEELTHLRHEVAELKAMLGAHTPASSTTGGQPAAAGGMGGTGGGFR